MSALTACSGERAFEQLQFCLGDETGLGVLKGQLQQIAQSQDMKFVDESADTLRDLKTIGSNLAKPPIIQMYVQNSRYGLTASNVGLGGYQVAIGFGPDSKEAREFAASVTRQLADRWKLKRIPLGEGAFPLPECAN